MTTIEKAKQWYSNNEIYVIEIDGKLCLPVRDDFLLELSDDEVNYRSRLFLSSELKKVNNE